MCYDSFRLNTFVKILIASNFVSYQFNVVECLGGASCGD